MPLPNFPAVPSNIGWHTHCRPSLPYLLWAQAQQWLYPHLPPPTYLLPSPSLTTMPTLWTNWWYDKTGWLGGTGGHGMTYYLLGSIPSYYHQDRHKDMTLLRARTHETRKDKLHVTGKAGVRLGQGQHWLFSPSLPCILVFPTHTHTAFLHPSLI